jgi:hypothetical protein
MVWAALTIILMQGVIAIIGLRLVRSFGAFVSTFLAAHTENVIVQSAATDLVERIERSARQIRRVSDQLQQHSIPPDQEKSA